MYDTITNISDNTTHISDVIATVNFIFIGIL